MKDKLKKTGRTKSHYRAQKTLKVFAFLCALGLGSALPIIIVSNTVPQEATANLAENAREAKIEETEEVLSYVDTLE
ncbi:MAG: hypothetical protein HUJ60_04015 [Bacilli bacterium]|nr:hypothetical protein [Bacilli bacterium]